MADRNPEQAPREDLLDLSDWSKGHRVQRPSTAPMRRRRTTSAPQIVDRMEAWLDHALSRDPVS